MSALSIATKSFRTCLALFAVTAFAAGCSGGDTSTDGATDATASSDARDATTMDTASDGPRLRDTGSEIALDSAYGSCFVSVSPRSGTRTDTFVVTGVGILNASSATLTISPEGGGSVLVNTTVQLNNGGFTYSVDGSMFQAGNYEVNVNDPTFTCSAMGPFTVTM